MPLLIITGIPCCGKSKRAQQIALHFKKKEKETITVSENEVANLGRNDLYSNSQSEKMARGVLKTEVLRSIGNEKLVILDGLNYIKGFRYELYCIAKQHRTPHCIVQCITDVDSAWRWNAERDEASRYSKEVFDALVYRYEAPDSRNRWDSPMITILSHQDPPYDAIHDALYLRKAPPPNQSTQIQPLSSNNFLFELDKSTQEVVAAIMAVQKTHCEGPAKIDCASECVNLNRRVSLAELTRFRRQFITYTKVNAIEDSSKIKNLFVQYINSTLNS